jgi:hypothetical protein
MKQLSLGLASAIGLMTLGTAVGCGDDGGSDGMPTGTATPPAPTTPAVTGCLTETAPDGSLLLRAVDANNYSLSNIVSIKQSEIGPGTDLTLDWSALTVDFFKHPIAAGDITNVTMAIFEAQYEQIKVGLEKDAMPDAVAGAWMPLDGTRTSVKLSEMFVPYTAMQKPTAEQLDVYFDPAKADPAIYSYTVTVNKGDLLKTNVKMIHHVRLNPAAPTTSTVALTNDSATIMATAQIGSKPAIQIPANTPGITVDWNAMVNNAVGEKFEDSTILGIRVLHFPFTADQLDSKILDLDISFDKEYKAEWTGAVAESEKLSILTDKDGQAFPGIDPSLGGTWVLALMCRNDVCGSPAPWYMARLEACP